LLDLPGETGIVRCAFFHGFPYTDIPQAGASVVVTTHDDPALARDVAQQLASEIWEQREEFRPQSLSPDIALRQAAMVVAERGGPVVINNTADNPGAGTPGAGTPGDATHVLRALIEAAPERACFGFIYDPGVARQAHEAGAGATIEVSLGGKHDEMHGAPLELQV
jgi:microcystin degradation protein MlrC